jgi:hypothetical protein
VTGFVVSLLGEFVPPLLDAIRTVGLLPGEGAWWFALAEDELILPRRCNDPARIFDRRWERLSLFGPRFELRWQARGRHATALLLLEAGQLPELPSSLAGKEERFAHVEFGIHLLWGEKQRLGNRPARGQVGFPRPLHYLQDETEETLQDPCVLEVVRYHDPRHQRQALRYSGVGRLPRRDWKRVDPFPEALKSL